MREESPTASDNPIWLNGCHHHLVWVDLPSDKLDNPHLVHTLGFLREVKCYGEGRCAVKIQHGRARWKGVGLSADVLPSFDQLIAFFPSYLRDQIVPLARGAVYAVSRPRRGSPGDLVMIARAM